MTGEKEVKNGNKISPDWLVRGVLTKLGEMFDRFTGRSWNPSSSLATSELIEKLKVLLDSEVRNLGKEGRFVPHDIRLMIQWDKFSTDSDSDLKKLEHELHAAAIDHINDRLYHTYAPLKIEIRSDYFTEGVRLLGSFGNLSENEDEEAAINVTLPNLKRAAPDRDGKISVVLNEDEIRKNQSIFVAKFLENGRIREVELDFSEKSRMSVGRTRESDLSINDRSVSKIHASLVLNSDRRLLIADTGSTNGTFINTVRIAYGKAVEVKERAAIKIGSVDVSLKRIGRLGPAAGEISDDAASDGASTGDIADRAPAAAEPAIEPPIAAPEPVRAADAPADKTVSIEAPGEGLNSPLDEEESDSPELDKTQDWEV